MALRSFIEDVIEQPVCDLVNIMHVPSLTCIWLANYLFCAYIIILNYYSLFSCHGRRVHQEEHLPYCNQFLMILNRLNLKM